MDYRDIPKKAEFRVILNKYNVTKPYRYNQPLKIECDHLKWRLQDSLGELTKPPGAKLGSEMLSKLRT